MHSDIKGLWLATIAIAGFSLTLPITRALLAHFDPLFIALGRAMVAATVAAGLLIIWGAPRPSGRQFIQLTVVGAGVVAGFPLLTSWAMQYLPASHGGVVIGVLPLATTLCATFIAGDRPSLKFWILSIVGSGIVIGFTLLQGGGRLAWADAALLAAVVCAAIGYALGARLAKDLGGRQVICWALVIMAPVLALPTWATLPSTLHAPLWAWAGFIYLALISQLFGFFAWYRALTLAGIARASQVQLLQPFMTLIAAHLLLGEFLAWHVWLFAGLVIAVVAWGWRVSRPAVTLNHPD